MQISGIIAEYNPFHLGHEYQIEELRRRGTTHIICVMSGNFVQRGEPAILSKEARVRAALRCGADLVLELPVPWATASAQRFAFGAVGILNALGCVDQLAFGSECGDLSLLQECADALSSPQFSAALRVQLESGIPFAKARQNALASQSPSLSKAVCAPNDTLAVEYLCALAKCRSPIEPVCIARTGAGHDVKDTRDGFASASRIREWILSGDYPAAAGFMPAPSFAVLQKELEAKQAPARLSLIERAMLAKLRAMTADDFAHLPDVSEGLHNRLYSALQHAGSLSELYLSAKSKRYSHARIRRLVLSAFLGIPQGLCDTPPPYLRILGMNAKGKEIIVLAGKSASIPLVGTYAQIRRLGEYAEQVFALECRAGDLYGLSVPTVQPCGSEKSYHLIKEAG